MGDANLSEPVPVKVATSDLPKRAGSAIIMLAVAIAAVWQGGRVLEGFIAVVALVCFAEFVRLIVKATPNLFFRLAAIIAGAVYIGGAGLTLANFQIAVLLLIIGAVICVDTFAYFFGRTIGGPKIAPAISPSKTWAGLLGGVVGATLWIGGYWFLFGRPNDDTGAAPHNFVQILGYGTAIAVAAQAGDFFESWLKRRAGVKDSSRLIPGHGGVFDRVDGLLAVALVAGLFGAIV